MHQQSLLPHHTRNLACSDHDLSTSLKHPVGRNCFHHKDFLHTHQEDLTVWCSPLHPFIQQHTMLQHSHVQRLVSSYQWRSGLCLSLSGGCELLLTNCPFDTCSAPNGGALHLCSGGGASAGMLDCAFKSCSATTNGGGISLVVTAAPNNFPFNRIASEGQGNTAAHQANTIYLYQTGSSAAQHRTRGSMECDAGAQNEASLSDAGHNGDPLSSSLCTAAPSMKSSFRDQGVIPVCVFNRAHPVRPSQQRSPDSTLSRHPPL